ncbi:MAG: GntR family transcriptional regulator [Fimbriimonadaceae bacterium]|nr:GntR family transcriptional regulator [Fimbriimonadaceae bacterium]
MAERVAKSLTYRRIHDELREAILGAEYAPGERFPTERDIAARFGVSRITANKILHGLVAERLLEYRHGVGTFVRNADGTALIAQSASLTEALAAAGHHVTSTVLGVTVSPSTEIPGWAVQDLALRGTSRVTAIHRNHTINHLPAVSEVAYVLSALVPGFTEADGTGSLFGYLTSQRGLTVQRVDCRIRPVTSTKAISKSFKIEHPSALFAVHKVLYLDDTSPMATIQQLWHPDRLELASSLNVFDSQPEGITLRYQP